MSIENYKRCGCKIVFEGEKNESEFVMYPFCIDTIEKIDGEIHNFDGTSGEIMSIKIRKGIRKLLLWLN